MFFAAIEQQRDPRLKGKPVIVGAGVLETSPGEPAARLRYSDGASAEQARSSSLQRSIPSCWR